jgi:hypothetical protein
VTDERVGHAALAARFPILQFFAFDHLPEELQEISRPFFVLAHQMVGYHVYTPHVAEVVAGLRKLLEAKDCMVRAALDDVAAS